MPIMKPIPTTYEGVKFRSRLEARWAVFFDQLELVWQYEPFTIEDNGKEYKPDFIIFNLLFNKPILIEIKPIEPNVEYLSYLKGISDPEKRAFLILIGEPNFECLNGIQLFDSQDQHEYASVILCKSCGFYKIQNHHNYSFCQCQAIHKPRSNYQTAKDFSEQYRFDLNKQ